MSHCNVLPPPSFSISLILPNPDSCSRGRNKYPLYFTVKETGALRSEVTCQMWPSYQVVKLSSSGGRRTPPPSSVTTLRCFQKGSQDSFMPPWLAAWWSWFPLRDCHLPGSPLAFVLGASSVLDADADGDGGRAPVYRPPHPEPPCLEHGSDSSCPLSSNRT